MHEINWPETLAIVTIVIWLDWQFRRLRNKK